MLNMNVEQFLTFIFPSVNDICVLSSGLYADWKQHACKLPLMRNIRKMCKINIIRCTV